MGGPFRFSALVKSRPDDADEVVFADARLPLLLFAIDDHTWAVVIGDVCGTGPAAASLTGLARYSIRESAWHADTPTQILQSLNRSILRSETKSFCTCIFATLTRDEIETTLTVTCGGHPLPILIRDGRATTIGTPGTLIGILPTITVTTTTTHLRSGDTVVLYTDGATDLPPPHGLTQEQMNELVQGASAETADETANSIQIALDTIQPFAARDDDLALLVLRVR